jgi:SOS regulatory protein LexA
MAPRKMSEETLRSRVRELSRFYRREGRMPSFAELGEITGLRSKNAVSKLVGRLSERGVLARDGKGRLIPRSLASPVRVLGTVEAGWPSPAEEELADTFSLEEYLVSNPEATFLLKVSGDSMSGAGILPGDMVLVDKGRPPKNGDIVVAEVDGAWTMKYLKKQGKKVTLLPANPRYKPIHPRSELRVAGVVTAVIRKYL